MYSSFDRFNSLRKLTEASKKRFLEPPYDELNYDEEAREAVMAETPYRGRELPQCEELVKFVDSGAIGSVPIDWNKFNIKIDGHTPDDKWNALLVELSKIVEAYYNWKDKGGSRKDQKVAKKIDQNLVFTQNSENLVVINEGQDTENADMVILRSLETEKFIFVVPLTWEACQWMDSSQCGGQSARWCLGYEQSNEYWINYTDDSNLFVLAYNKEENPKENERKYMLQIAFGDDDNLEECKGWQQHDDPDDVIACKIWERKFGRNVNDFINAFYDSILNHENVYTDAARTDSFGWFSNAHERILYTRELERAKYKDITPDLLEIDAKEAIVKCSECNWYHQLTFDFEGEYLDGIQLHASEDKNILDIPTFISWLHGLGIQKPAYVAFHNAHIRTVVFEPEAIEGDWKNISFYFVNCTVSQLKFADWRSQGTAKKSDTSTGSDAGKIDFDSDCKVKKIHWMCTESEFNSMNTDSLWLPRYELWVENIDEEFDQEEMEESVHLKEASKGRIIKPFLGMLYCNPFMSDAFESVIIDYISKNDKIKLTKFPTAEELTKFADGPCKEKINWQAFINEVNLWKQGKKVGKPVDHDAFWAFVDLVTAYAKWNKEGSTAQKKLAMIKDPNLIFTNNKMKLKVTEGPQLGGYDMLHLKSLDNDDFIFYVPLNHAACVWMDSFDCGGEGAKWCIGQSDNPTYWDHYLMEDNYFVLAFSKKAYRVKNPEFRMVDTLKYMLQVHYSGFKDGDSTSTTSQAWCQSDDPNETVSSGRWPKKFGVSLEDLVDAIEDNYIKQTEYFEKSGENFRDELIRIARG